ncbi:hypothetical protein QTP81_06430 [Alteromonas sp. ASW11-36]|uniref:KfrA N-terminal DNA-binding domain-containing protein n=1 Tax=Alteromonas arenosi TaxID=3055817 RepID=A0ABT7SVM9_9ALTE|nr:hypothetical protein [Alteromonas sp. ASW11-36]MDM7860226.1 hypothetical protein [Alteromonas sp. ASW11-36]
MTPAIQQLCLSLYQQGLEPTTSLLRAKSSPKLTLPQAVKAIQWWQQQDKEHLLRTSLPLPIKEEPETRAINNLAELEQRLEKAEAEVAELKAALAALKAGQ